jgi:peptide/nickel transport system ATP-binding protein
VEEQIVEAILAHEEVTREEARERVSRLFELVGLEPELAKHFPHEYSGGMRQRAVIAMALACYPKLLIADEPTTALDVIHQRQIIEKIRELRERLGMTLIYITHDISIIAETCNSMAVMYAGRIVEYSGVEALLSRPLHPYTQGLIRSIPALKGPLERLASIEGEAPNLLSPPKGCSFHPRCPYSKEICARDAPSLRLINGRHYAACHFAGEIPWP